MPVIDLADARLALGIGDADDSVDDLLQGYVDGITKVIERHTGLTIDSTELVERYRLNGRRFALRSVPVISIDALATVDGLTVWSPDDFLVDADSGIVEWNGVTGTNLYGHVQVSYTAGYTDIPEHLRQGALIVLKQLWEANRGVGSEPAGVVGPEETFNADQAELLTRKALEWLGPHAPVLA